MNDQNWRMSTFNGECEPISNASMKNQIFDCILVHSIARQQSVDQRVIVCHKNLCSSSSQAAFIVLYKVSLCAQCLLKLYFFIRYPVLYPIDIAMNGDFLFVVVQKLNVLITNKIKNIYIFLF